MFLKKVNTIKDAYILKDIRNQCASYMTNNTDIITDEQQSEWYYTIYIPHYVRFNMVALLVKDGGDDVGYGLVRIEDGKVWLTGGLIESYRSKGYGRTLFEGLIAEAQRLAPKIEVALTVRKDNERAFKLYKSLGFIIIDEDDKIWEMILR